MAKNETLHARKREATGTKACRRLRADGQVPAVVYGRGQDTVAIQVPADEIEQALRHHSRMFDLRLGRKKESVLLRDIQHDALGDEVVHADFARIAMDEVVEIKVALTLKGTPKVEHAVLQQLLDAVEVECLPGDIPETIVVPVGGLEIGDSLTVADLKAPDGVKVLSDPDTVIAALTHAAVEEVTAEEAAAAAEAAAEPERIGRVAEDEGQEEGETPSKGRKEGRGD